MLRTVARGVCCSIPPMTNPSNLRARIAAGEELVMLRGDIGWSTEQLAAAWAGGTYDFIWLDSQHSPYSDHHLVSFTASAEQLGIPVQLRVPHTREAHKVGRFFDLGITGALVPEVMEDSTVQDAIDFAYYGPIGRRSWGGVNRLGLRNHAAPTARRAYADWWNATVLLSIQIESVETVRNIARLVRPGITHVTWGPNDLEFSLEKHADPALNSVEACMRHVARQLEGSGIRMSMGTASMPEERQTFREVGVTIFQASS
jgi:2-keto-3-deoxy-L-rhamnonate aldolase RhmA